MRKKIVSGLLAMALVFTSVPTNVIALGAGGNTDRHNISMTNPFASTDNGDTTVDDQSSSSSTTNTNPFANATTDSDTSDSTSSNSTSSNNTNPFANSGDNQSSSSSTTNTNPFANATTDSDTSSNSTNPFGSSGNVGNDSSNDNSNDDVTSNNTSSNPFNSNTNNGTSLDEEEQKPEQEKPEVVPETSKDTAGSLDLNNNSNDGIATLDETAMTTAAVDYIKIVIDTTNIDTSDGYDLKFNSGISLNEGNVSVDKVESSTSALSLFSKINAFTPMAINSLFIDLSKNALISNSVGYFQDNGFEDVSDVALFIGLDNGALKYDSTAIGIANFKPGSLPVFDVANDFENADPSIVFTGWKFDPAVTIGDASGAGVIATSVASLTLSELGEGSTVTFAQDQVTTITATFSTSNIGVEGSVVHIDSSFTNYSALTANLYEKTGNRVASVSVGSTGAYSFASGIVSTGYEYYVVITGSDIDDSDPYIFTATNTDMVLNKIYVDFESATYTVEYDKIVGTTPTVVKESYEVGELVTLKFDDSYHLQLEGMGLEWTDWLFKNEYSTDVFVDVDVDVVLSSKENLVFKMPAIDICVWPDSVENTNGYTVYYYSDGEVEKTITSLKLGDTIPYYTPDSRHGYTFTGWYTNAACTSEWSFDTEIAASHFSNDNKKYLYAGWEGNTVNVVIDYDVSSDNSGQLTTMKVGQSRTISAGTKAGSSFNYWSWYNDSIFEYSYSMNSYVTPNILTSTISFVVPPLDEGDTLSIQANWEPLYAFVYVDNIIDGYTEGDSAYVYISSSTHGTVTGEFAGFNASGDEYYYFDLEGFGSGMYTVEIVSRTSNQEFTTVMYVEDGEFNHVYVTLLPEDKIATVTNTATNVLNVGSDNLSEMFTSSELTSDDVVTIDMQVSNVTSTNADAQLILNSLSTNQAVGLFLDISLLKTIGTTKYQMFDTPNSKGLNVIVQLPDSFKSQKSYFVSTVHDGVFSTISSSQVTYDSDSNSISFYATEFSVFGIGYSGTSGSSSLVGTSIPTDAGYDIPLFQNVVVGQYVEGLGKYVLVHPDSTNWSFAGWYHGVTLVPLTANELISFVVTETILTNGIYPRFVQVDEYGNPLTSPVPQTGVTTLANLF